MAIWRWKKALFTKNTFTEFSDLKNLQQLHYDAILYTQGLMISSTIAKLANGKSYGQDSNTVREDSADRLINRPFCHVRSGHALLKRTMEYAIRVVVEIP
jgi:heptosyltransferase-1